MDTAESVTMQGIEKIHLDDAYEDSPQVNFFQLDLWIDQHDHRLQEAQNITECSCKLISSVFTWNFQKYLL